jgi:hypothetical protein
MELSKLAARSDRLAPCLPAVSLWMSHAYRTIGDCWEGNPVWT